MAGLAKKRKLNFENRKIVEKKSYMIQKLFLLVRSLVILSIMLYLGNLIGYYIPRSVPGSIWGLLLLF